MRSKTFLSSLLLCIFSWQIATAESISIMSYNIENLFDTQHDEGKKDWTYLPLAYKNSSQEVQNFCRAERNPFYRNECYKMDWSDQTMQTKIQNITSVIRAFDPVNNGPDVILFSEVENIIALQKLVDQGLAGMGYQTVVLIEGPDERGIDVGVVSKFAQILPAKLHKVNLSQVGSGKSNTRGVLEVHLNAKGKKLSVYANHWPSQMAPSAARIAAANTLLKASKKSKSDIVVAAGDFNTLHNETPNAIKDIMTNTNSDFYFFDAVNWKGPSETSGPNGSHFYRNKWDFLDKILISNKSFKAIKTVDFMVHAPEFAMKPSGRRKSTKAVQQLVPLRFSAETGQGFSDHLPIVSIIELKD